MLMIKEEQDHGKSLGRYEAVRFGPKTADKSVREAVL